MRLNVPVLAMWLALLALVVAIAVTALPGSAAVGVLPLVVALAWRTPRPPAGPQ